MNQPSLFGEFHDALERRDSGMKRAEAHAVTDIDDWRERADYSLLFFARTRGGKSFLAEDWIEWARAAGLPDPPDGRAYGPVVQRLARQKLIKWVGYAPANSS